MWSFFIIWMFGVLCHPATVRRPVSPCHCSASCVTLPLFDVLCHPATVRRPVSPCHCSTSCVTLPLFDVPCHPATVRRPVSPCHCSTSCVPLPLLVVLCFWLILHGVSSDQYLDNCDVERGITFIPYNTAVSGGWGIVWWSKMSTCGHMWVCSQRLLVCHFQFWWRCDLRLPSPAVSPIPWKASLCKYATCLSTYLLNHFHYQAVSTDPSANRALYNLWQLICIPIDPYQTCDNWSACPQILAMHVTTDLHAHRSLPNMWQLICMPTYPYQTCDNWYACPQILTKHVTTDLHAHKSLPNLWQLICMLTDP